MRWIPRLSLLMVFSSSLLAGPPHRLQACLPDGIQATDIVSTEMARSAAGGREVKRLTVEQKLLSIKAQCKKGKLVDAMGKEVRFYRLHGCWGNPPADYQEILERQQRELDKLKQRYTVIEMTCNPEGVMIH
jgi:hypothetical protein